MIEGAITLATAAVGRFRSGNRTGSTFPFTVSHMGAGNGKLAPDEGNRQEIWLPLWSKPARFREISHLFSEGRAQNGAKQARNPVEFSLALASHGTSRGLSGFSRFGFLQRNGKSFFATPLGFYSVGERDGASLIRRLERYFSSYRGLIKEHSAGSMRLLNRYDTAVLEYLKTGSQTGMTAILERLGDFHCYLAGNEKLCEKIRPLPELDDSWVQLANEDSPEFRLALSLSSLGAGRLESEFNLRAQLSPYHPRRRAWDLDDFIPRWSGRDLSERLVSLLEYRLREADRVGFSEEKGSRKPYNSPIRGHVSARLDDIEQFLAGNLDENRLESLLFGLALVKPQSKTPKSESEPWFIGLPYLVTKLSLHQGLPMRETRDGETIPTGPGAEDFRDVRVPPVKIVRMLATGNPSGAMRAAQRFLLSRPLIIKSDYLQDVPTSRERLRRMAAALLFPINDRTYRQLYHRIMPENQEKESEQNHE
jgi:CRISPR-associated protein Csx17